MTSENFISVPYLKKDFDKPESCPICTDSFDNNDKPLSCGHWVHMKCQLKWGDNCSICREKIELKKEEQDIVDNIKKQRKEEEEKKEHENLVLNERRNYNHLLVHVNRELYDINQYIQELNIRKQQMEYNKLDILNILNNMR